METKDRIKRAHDALDGYAAKHSHTHTQVRELLRDLRHFCRQEGISFAELDILARQDYLDAVSISKHVEGRDYDVMPGSK
jgi:hypothetical protein